MQDRWKDGIFVGLQGLGYKISRVVIHLASHGVPSVKPEAVIALGYETNPLYHQLQTSLTNLTNVMAELRWDDGAFADNQKMEGALNGYGIALKKINRQKGEPEAQRMLNAAIEKISNSQFFQTLPDNEIIRPRWEQTLRTHFDLALHGIGQAHSQIS